MQTLLERDLQLAVLEVERNAAVEVLDRLHTAVMLCDPSGAPVIVNRAARELLASGDGLVVRGGRLAARSQHENDALQNLISHAGGTAHSEGNGSGRTLLVSRASGLRPLSVLVSPIRAPSAIPGQRRIAMAIFVSDPEAVVMVDAGRLLQLYGLTRAESRLAAKISQGMSLDEAAAALSITTQTARSYLKRILSKTATKRQVELVRLLLLGPTNLN